VGAEHPVIVFGVSTVLLPDASPLQVELRILFNQRSLSGIRSGKAAKQNEAKETLADSHF